MFIIIIIIIIIINELYSIIQVELKEKEFE